MQQHLDDIFRWIDAAEHDEKPDAIDRAWYEVCGMQRMIAGGGQLTHLPPAWLEEGSDFREYKALRDLLTAALKRLEVMFAQATGPDGEETPPNQAQ